MKVIEQVNMVNSELKTFYNNKKVFLTGHTGFKGSWLLYWLHSLGAQVKGYALDPEEELNLYDSIKGDNFCESIIADIRDYERFEKEVSDFQPDVIFHLAAQPIVKKSYVEPLETLAVNVNGTANVLQAVKTINKPCQVVIITTDKVYENKEWYYPYREEDRLGGYDPYSMSKACAELVVSSFRNSFFNIAQIEEHGVSIASVRAGNVIGGGDWTANRLLPDIVRAIAADKEVEIRNPFAVRPWQHVVEPLAGYLEVGMRLAENPVKYSGAWNFGPEPKDCIPVGKVVEESIKIWEKGAFQALDNYNGPHEAKLLMLDINKSLYELSWKPKFDVLKALEHTINWYKDYYEDATTALPNMDKTIKDYLWGKDV